MGEIRTTMINILLFSMVVLGFTAFISDLVGDYSMSYTNLGFMNKTAEMNVRIANIQAAMNTTDMSAIERVQSFFSSTYNVLMLVPDSVNVVSTIIFEAGTILGLPWWVVPGMLAIFTTFIIFAVISALQKHDI